MELSASAVRATQFREAKYGYHPADVDAFMEAVAVAIELTEQRARTALEQSLKDEADPFQRALLTAKLTADLVSTAQARANETLSDLATAKRRAQEIIAKAEVIARAENMAKMPTRVRKP